MNTHDEYELPPLPQGYCANEIRPNYAGQIFLENQVRDYALSAIEADRQQRREPVGELAPTFPAGNSNMLGGVYKLGFFSGQGIPVYTAPQPAEPGKEMTKPTMPEPVGKSMYVLDEVGNLVPTGYTPDQLEAYADAKVREALQEAGRTADDWAMRHCDNATDNNAIFLEHLQNYNLEVQQALTYLSLWNLESFDKVEIFFEKDLSISARYSSSQHLRSYFLAGIWNQDTNTYTFHS